MPRADLPHVFVSADTAANLCEISSDTWRLWVSTGIVPPASIRQGQIVRWHWPTVEAMLASSKKSALDGDVALGRIRDAKGKTGVAS